MRTRSETPGGLFIAYTGADVFGGRLRADVADVEGNPLCDAAATWDGTRIRISGIELGCLGTDPVALEYRVSVSYGLDEDQVSDAAPDVPGYVSIPRGGT